MTEDELAQYAEALAASASMWRSSAALGRAEGEAMLVAQGLSPDEARAVIDYGLAHRWLVEEIKEGAAVLRPGARAISRP